MTVSQTSLAWLLQFQGERREVSVGWEGLFLHFAACWSCSSHKDWTHDFAVHPPSPVLTWAWVTPVIHPTETPLAVELSEQIKPCLVKSIILSIALWVVWYGSAFTGGIVVSKSPIQNSLHRCVYIWVHQRCWTTFLLEPTELVLGMPVNIWRTHLWPPAHSLFHHWPYLIWWIWWQWLLIHTNTFSF